MNIPYVMKKCTCCGRWLVASTVNFPRNKDGRDGLRSQCKECTNKKRKQYRETNKNKIKQYREDNKEKILEYRKQYYQDNKEKIAEQQKQYHEDNKEKIAEYKKQYYQTPQGQVAIFNSRQRRRKKKEQQGTGITPDQWLEMMKFFDWRCAYAGKRLTDKTRSIDHIVPLDAGGDNMIWNCVPMTRSLNSSKSTKDMIEWYKEQSFYSEARLEKIYKWQEYAYNKYGKNSEYFNSGNIQIKLI